MKSLTKFFTESFFDPLKLQADQAVERLVAQAEGELSQMKQTWKELARKYRFQRWFIKGILILV